MTDERMPDCARCGKTLQRSHQFCPECGLPATGGSVLSSQIGELRKELATSPRAERRPWRRLLVPTASAVMTAMVLAVGLLLFNRPLIDMFFPPGEEARAAPLEIAPRWEPQWVLLPKGTFHSGRPFEVSESDLNMWPTPAENIEQHRITNGDWLRFLLEDEAHLSALGMWEAAIPRRAAGWTTDPSGRPVVLDNEDTGLPDLEALVGDVTNEEIRLYRYWIESSAESRIERFGITNDRWLGFLFNEEARLRKEGLWQGVLPDPSSGWRIAADAFPIPPSAPPRDVAFGLLEASAERAFASLARLPFLRRSFPRTDDTEQGLALTASVPRTLHDFVDGFPRGVERVEEIAELGGNRVEGVNVEAVRRFHEWASRVEVPREFQMSRYEIRNVLWREFLEEEETALRERGLWAEAVPGPNGGWVLEDEGRYTPPANELDMPVRYVSARAVRAFGDYLTRRLGEPDVEIRMPTPLEWEYAARGTTWNVYPWGNKFPGRPAQRTGDPKTRRGIDENFPFPVDYVDEDTSPLGVVGLGVNVAECVEAFADEDLDGDGRIERDERRYLRTEIRGASFAFSAPDARYRARVWDRSIMDPRAALAYAGIRLVKVRTGE